MKEIEVCGVKFELTPYKINDEDNSKWIVKYKGNDRLYLNFSCVVNSSDNFDTIWNYFDQYCKSKEFYLPTRHISARDHSSFEIYITYFNYALNDEQLREITQTAMRPIQVTIPFQNAEILDE